MKKEKLLYAPAGTGTQLDKINETLDSGWEMVQIQSTKDGCFVWVKKIDEQTTPEQQVFRMYIGDASGENRLNKLLEDGWNIKDMHSISENGDCCSVFWLEKK